MTYKKRSNRMQAVRCEHDGIKFDSKSERDFYLKLVRTFNDCRILRPCQLRLPGKVRSWKCDFGMVAKTEQSMERLTKLKITMQGISPNTLTSEQFEAKLTECLYLEYKGDTDPATGLCRVDKNFKSRVDWLTEYADHILEDFLVVGNGTGAILSYCATRKFRVTPIHSSEYFFEQGTILWSAC